MGLISRKEAEGQDGSNKELEVERWDVEEERLTGDRRGSEQLPALTPTTPIKPTLLHQKKEALGNDPANLMTSGMAHHFKR